MHVLWEWVGKPTGVCRGWVLVVLDRDRDRALVCSYGQLVDTLGGLAASCKRVQMKLESVT